MELKISQSLKREILRAVWLNNKFNELQHKQCEPSTPEHAIAVALDIDNKRLLKDLKLWFPDAEIVPPAELF